MCPPSGEPVAEAPRTLAFTNKKGDKTTISGRVLVSDDGKTLTVTTNATAPNGAKFTSTAVYDKQ